MVSGDVANDDISLGQQSKSVAPAKASLEAHCMRICRQTAAEAEARQ